MTLNDNKVPTFRGAVPKKQYQLIAATDKKG